MGTYVKTVCTQCTGKGVVDGKDRVHVRGNCRGCRGLGNVYLGATSHSARRCPDCNGGCQDQRIPLTCNQCYGKGEYLHYNIASSH